MNKKTALVIGSTGQDGAYLTKLLLEKGYRVVGTRRRTSMLNTQRLDWICKNLGEGVKSNLKIEYADLCDSLSLTKVINQERPDEIYNLGAQSHVAISFEQPEYTTDVNALGPLRVLEAARALNEQKEVRVYQASTSELFGEVLAWPQTEETQFNPVSPYAAAKHFAHQMVNIYREAYGLYACSGILFNHESPIRGSNFVTKKIVHGLVEFVRSARILELGNLDSIRDWGHAEDYVEMQWLMLNQEKPRDYVIATGTAITVREFVDKVAGRLNIELEWHGSGIDEFATCKSAPNSALVGARVIQVNPEYFRPLEVARLLGNAEKAKSELKWLPKHDLQSMISDMVAFEQEEHAFDVI